MSDGTGEENIKNRGEIIREATALSTTLYFSQALYMIRGFIIAHVLDPSTYGVWTLFRTIFSGAPYLGLGSQQALTREVPFSIGEGDESKAPVMIQTSLSWNLLITSCIMVIVFILSFTPLIKEYNTEIRLAGFVFVLNGAYLFLQPKLRSENKIRLLSKYMLSYAILNFLFGLSFLFLFEIKGLLLGMMISHLILFAVIISKSHLSFRLILDRKVLWKLMNIGFPIMILWSLFFLMRNVDKFIVFTMLGKTMAGYYGLAAFISSMVSYISTSISAVLFPRIMYTYGKTRNTKDIEMYFTRPMIILAGFIPIILGIMYINIDAIVKLFLPQYMPSVVVLQILIIGLFFAAIWGLPTNILVALNKQKMFMYIIAAVSFAGAILDVIIIQIGFGMTGVAIVAACMFMIASVTANYLTLLLFKNHYLQIWRSLGRIYLPFIYSFVGLMLIELIPISNRIIIDSLVKSLIYLAYCIPLFLYTEKKSGIIGKIFSAAKDFKK